MKPEWGYLQALPCPISPSVAKVTLMSNLGYVLCFTGGGLGVGRLMRRHRRIGTVVTIPFLGHLGGPESDRWRSRACI
jgi:hypothetical protein